MKTKIAALLVAAMATIAIIGSSPAEAKHHRATAHRYHHAKVVKNRKHARYRVRYRVRSARTYAYRGYAYHETGTPDARSNEFMPVINSLVATARKYLGTNPTGRRSLWCGAFMDKILRETGHKPGSNLAKAYLHYGRRVSGPQIGAIAVMGRRGGGHVGVVSGIDANGNPIVISGNHHHTTAESTYRRSRILAYVMPS